MGFDCWSNGGDWGGLCLLDICLVCVEFELVVVCGKVVWVVDVVLWVECVV